MCMARAILRKSSILVMDEATASVDFQTDQLIQSMIQRQFSECTVITIAHRLHTVLNWFVHTHIFIRFFFFVKTIMLINSDEILVLDAGRVVEKGTPLDLVGANGIFAALVAATNDDSLFELISQLSERKKHL